MAVHYGPEPNVLSDTISTPVTDVAYVRSIKRISWAAVFAGVILAFGIQLLLSMLGTGIGMSMIDPARGETPSAETLSISAAVWWVLSGLIALFTAGWVAARLAGIPRPMYGAIHGLLTWGLSTLLLLFFIGTALGALIGGTFSLVGGRADVMANIAAQALPETDIWTDIRREAQALLQQRGRPGLQPRADEEFDLLLSRLIRQARVSRADRDAVVNALAARTDMTQAEATRTVNNWIRTYQQARTQTAQQARQAADEAAEIISKSSLWGFIALLIGAAAAACGGIVGTPPAPVVIPPRGEILEPRSEIVEE